jgi:hypothetical protein
MLRPRRADLSGAAEGDGKVEPRATHADAHARQEFDQLTWRGRLIVRLDELGPGHGGG